MRYQRGVTDHFQADRGQRRQRAVHGGFLDQRPDETARGGVERRRGDGLGVGRTSRPAACKRFRNSRQASIFAVPVSVTQPRCSHSVAANSWRANPGSHATVAQTSATSCALNSRPLCTQLLDVITSIAEPSPAQIC
ncbi:MAG TPA: hypothetical protein DIT03_10680 [Candidatus Accumulibacter sp.]|nr:hypothetical protein [Accumulibacter sp.]